MSEKPKPCPFCGVSSGLYFDDGDTHRWMWVHCAGCDIGFETRKVDYGAAATAPVNSDCGTTRWNERIADNTRLAKAEELLTKVLSLKGLGAIAIRKQVKSYFEEAA